MGGAVGAQQVGQARGGGDSQRAQGRRAMHHGQMHNPKPPPPPPTPYTPPSAHLPAEEAPCSLAFRQLEALWRRRVVQVRQGFEEVQGVREGLQGRGVESRGGWEAGVPGKVCGGREAPGCVAHQNHCQQLSQATAAPVATGSLLGSQQNRRPLQNVGAQEAGREDRADRQTLSGGSKHQASRWLQAGRMPVGCRCTSVPSCPTRAGHATRSKLHL